MNNNYGQQLYQEPQGQQSRVPPQAVEVEEGVLGSMMIEEEAALIAFEMLSAEDFYKQAHGKIFQTMLDLFMDDKNLDMMTVEAALRDKDMLDACGGSGYLSELTRSVSSAANIDYHSQIIVNKSKKRKLIKECSTIISDAYQADSDTDELLERAEQTIFELAQSKSTNSAKHVRDHLEKVLERYERVMNDPDDMDGIFCGLDIDKILTGFKDNSLYILAARPSMGKSSMLLAIARGLANNGHNAGILSLEMSGEDLTDRLVLMESHINGQKARKGDISEEEFKRMIDASGRIFEQNIYVDDTPALSLMQFRSKARHMVQRHNCKIILLDYLQLMSYSGNAGTREQEISKISRGLKQTAKELEVPVVALSQLSRAVEQRGGDKRPQLSDLRSSGSIEQDADAVMFLYRPEYYGITTTPEGQSTDGLAEVLVSKQRNGPTGMIPMHFVKEYANFQNPSHIYEDEEQAPF